MKFFNPRTPHDHKARDLLVSESQARGQGREGKDVEHPQCGNYHITREIVRGFERYSAWFCTPTSSELLGSFSKSSLFHRPDIVAIAQCEMHALTLPGSSYADQHSESRSREAA